MTLKNWLGIATFKISLAAALLVGSVGFSPAAEARPYHADRGYYRDHHYRHGRYHRGHKRYRNHRHHRHYRRDRDRNKLGYIVGGLVLGGIIVDALHRNDRYANNRYRNEGRVIRESRVVDGPSYNSGVTRALHRDRYGNCFERTVDRYGDERLVELLSLIHI